MHYTIRKKNNGDEVAPAPPGTMLMKQLLPSILLPIKVMSLPLRRFLLTRSDAWYLV
jgi:hypothetical protein